MATAHACAALVGVLPGLLRVKRAVVGSSGSQAFAMLDAVRHFRRPRVSEVADHLALDLSTVSRQVAHLRQRGLLAACPDPEDRRSQRLTITAAGMDQLRRYRRDLVDRLVERLADWDDVDVDTLTGLLSRLDDSADGSTASRTTTPIGLPRQEPAPHLQRNA
jgi:DNA-binding MarR family transcriptional regulator